MAKDTRSRLLEAALTMFAQHGYAGTNIRELSASLGLGKSSLYRHFESKDEIWNAMLDEMERYYALHFGSPENLPAVPRSAEELKALTLGMLRFTIYDEKITMTRKILLTEQFRDERVRGIATAHFNVGLEEMFTEIFRGMMENGALRQNDAAMLAFAYTAPISSLVHLCDREPSRRGEVMEKIAGFIDHFADTYGGEHEETT